MPLRAFYIGEPLQARGWQLAGARTACPEPAAGAVWSVLQSALADSDLVLLDTSLSKLVATRLAHLLERSPLPPVLRVGSLEDADLPARELLESARRELGIA